MNKIIFPTPLKLGDPENLPTAGKSVGDLHSVLLKLKYEIKSSDLARKELGASTIDAIRIFQERANLPADGRLTADTVVKLNAELAHNFVTQSKTRTQRMQELLLQTGQQIDPKELKSRKFGSSTVKALKAAQANLGISQDGLVSEAAVDKLREEALKAKLGAKTQVAQVQRTLLRALNIAKLKEVRINADELKGKRIGPSTQAAIKAIQTKYGLQATGQLDAATFDRLTSIAVSIPEPVRQLKARSAAELKPLKKNARLNMKSEHVADVQSALAFLGFKVNESEFKNKVFGKSTREAVVSYQQARGLAVTGHVSGDTLKSLNREIQRLNPNVVVGQYTYRIRGSVRNELWQGMAGIVVQIWEKLVIGQGAKLAERKTGFNGFFDIPYDPPRDPANKQIKRSYHLQIKFIDAANKEIGSKLLFYPTQIAWANFTKGKQPYRGTSEFQVRVAAVTKAIGNYEIADLVETDTDRQISRAARAAGLVDEDVMRLALAHRVSAELNHPPVGAETCYAFIAQNLPPTLPGDLINSTEDWALIDNVVDLVANGLVFMEEDLKVLAFDNAITKNLISIAVGLQKDAIIAALAQLKQAYVLEKPILVGNGSLKRLLDSSTVGQAHYPSVASAFLKHKSFGPEFWADVSARPADFGGPDAIKDLRTTVEVGHVTKNFDPMLVALKQKFADPNVKTINSARDLAKLSLDAWKDLINANGGQIPPNTDGQSEADKVQTYAATLVNQSERMFPDVALVATVARGDNSPLPKPIVEAVQDLMDQNPELDLRTGNIDVFVNKHSLDADDETLTAARVLQRVHRIAPTATAGQALLDNNIHNSAQIIAMGKDQFVATLIKDKKIDSRTAMTIYGFAEYQYAQVLQRIADYRFDLHHGDPVAIVDHTYTKEELPEELAAIPNLETLFGSLDFCACDHCQSVYGPAAYLADVLRFLEKHDSEVNDPNHPGKKKSVQALLFERRPDIGNIKLNCQNTETPLPYIDLVCEVLENAIAAPNPAPDFSFQTTRTAAELRAAPEHVRLEAYDKLRTANFPLNTAFDLWQEQTRVFLQHLGVPRWELMEAYQARPQGRPSIPSDTSIAGEYWGMSTYETAIVVASHDNTDAKQRVYWGISSLTIPSKMSVADFLRRSFLNYNELLELLYVKWINPTGDVGNMLKRPEATCDTEQQQLVNLDADRLDKIHRFLRLRRHVGWSMWEIDLLIRSKAIGKGKLNKSCLVRMQQLARLQKRLGFPLDRILALFGNINTEARVTPDRPTQPIPSLYEALFQNLAVVNPVDAAFGLPIASGKHIADSDPNLDHRRTVIAAFALTAADLERLQSKLPNNNLSLANLSRIGRYTWLAKGLGISVKDLLALEDLSGVADIFATPKTTLDFIESADWVKKSPFTVDELDYLLKVNPKSALGLREEVVTQYIEAMRQALGTVRTNNIVVREIATTFGIATDQAKCILETNILGKISFSQVLRDPRLVAQDNAEKLVNDVTLQDFPDIYAVFSFLHDKFATQYIEGLRRALVAGQSSNAASIIVSQIATTFGIAADKAQLILEKEKLGENTYSQVLLDQALISQDDTGNFTKDVTLANFPDVFAVFRLLHNIFVTQYIETLRYALLADRTNNIIANQVATTFGIATNQAQLLLEQTKLGANTLSQVLQDPTLVSQDDRGKFAKDVTQANFPDIYTVYRLLHKATLVVLRFKLDAMNLKWLLANATTFGLLQPNVLPTGGKPGAQLFPVWLNLAKWMYFKGLYPEPEGSSLRGVFDLAGVKATPIASIKAAIADLTQWKTSEVDELVTALSLQHGGASSGFADVDNYLRMDKCRRMAKRIGVTPAKAYDWAKRDDDAIQILTAQEAKQAAKSKYDDAVWLQKVTPLEDALREKKRDALIGYLVANSLVTMSPEIKQGGKRYANPAYWRDGNDLLKYFLIDVEMCACQLTSRIKQAISSTQMFVQRCLLGLEQPRVEVSRAEQQDTVSDNSWKQWKWMKSYRIWEANRKVFLYPENWIEPELRDDKSPFFEELESELLQSDMTDENAEQAFLHYVQKVHEVARLDIVGAYYELDDTDPRDNLPPDINLLHVVGRTRAQPAIYFYRKFDLNYGEWSAWEKIDLDIQSDQVIPVIYNRRLYLFWLSFMEKPQKVKKLPPAKASENPGNSPEPPNQLELQLCWSAQKDAGWTAKKVSHHKLIHPWQRPLYSYNLKPRYKSRDNLLWLDVYISQSQGFNSTQFWDAYRNKRDYVTARHPFDETARPWHSSSFVFDGEVVDVKMKALVGQYHILNSDGVANEFLSPTTSLSYVHDNFGEVGRSITQLSGEYEIAPRLPLPDGMRYRNTKLGNNSQNGSRVNVLENSHSRSLLSGAKSPFEIVASQHSIVFDTAAWGPVPFFYQDNTRTFFIKPEWQQVIVGYNQTLQTYNYNFFPFYHPYTALFLRELKRSGLDGLLNRQIQSTPQGYYPGNSFDFGSYNPGSLSLPDKTAKNDRVDFERYGAYALYNWEIFFHAPLMVACKLSQNQRFEEAMRWFHYIFDPTNTESPDVPQRYWITKPFFEQNSDVYRQQRIDNLLKNIEQHQDELRAWKNNPFKPHLIARYRPVAYQKTVVMKYIDNLIAWGDQLFRRDTIEAINEATTLYLLAYELLGRRPVKVPEIQHSEKSYNELAANGGLDPFGNKQVDILMENFTGTPVRVTRTQSGTEPLPTLNVFYFGIPNNDRLLTYWDTVEDRLFKIRHCMNIQGVVRQLPLFEPPIDPALLVKAAAAGVDLGSVIADLAVAPASYRFRQLSQKALEFCSEVKGLGDKLLTVLEKGDAEGLSLLRSSQEIALQQTVREIKKQQINEANETWASLEKSKLLAQQKQEYYKNREFMNALEIVSAALAGGSIVVSGTLSISELMAAVFHLAPSFNIGISGFGGSPEVTVQWGTENIAKAISSTNSALQHVGSLLSQGSALVGTIGSFQRRKDEWDLQEQLATTEIAQIEKQIAAAQIRLSIAEKDLENQGLQIEQSQAIDEYMRSKYTNQQLFDWQARQIATIYFQSYQLAYDMAKRAEKCFQHERGDATSTFVQFGYWDSLKKGLLAGEHLANDIRRMEATYLEQNGRDLEVTKHISLAQFFPLSLLALKEAGACTIVLPEWLFDMDYPGHYFRRLKSVSISIPCVVGPYTSINCTLSLTNHGIRVRKDVAAGYGNPLAAGDERFFKSTVTQTAIATSHGQNDSGMFELNFNDERFLPFEGAGAVSEWRLELPMENNQFDLAAVSDVVLHVRYTARPSGDTNLTQAAKDNVAAVLPPLGLRMFVLNQEFSGEWYRFLYPKVGQDQVLTFNLGLEHLPFYARGKKNINLTKVDLIVEGAKKADNTDANYTVELTPPGGPVLPDIPMDPDQDYGGRQSMAKDGFSQQASVLGSWMFRIRRTDDADYKSLPPDDLKNAYLVLSFKTSDMV